jgi:signal transduction histidine kinase
MAIEKYILDRIEDKKSDYQRYRFTERENDALKTFFDLAQEFGGIEDFCRLCVAVPKCFFDLEARLYLVDAKINALTLFAATREDEGAALHLPPPEDVRPSESPYYTARQSLVLPIRGKKLLIDKLPFHVEADILGLLEVYPVQERDRHGELFFEKYANRIGFRLHNKFLVEKNLEHLRFIRSLVADIEHNVIVPNIVYKLFLKRLRAQVLKNKEIEGILSAHLLSGEWDAEALESALKDLTDVNLGLFQELENIERHYKNMSLFIETLFRQSHFDQGRLTLRTKPCNMLRDVVQPQLERYLEQFKKEGISIDDRMSRIPEEDIINVVDVGLIAQVYANFFSNALKYTQEIVTETGERKKYIAYGHHILKDYFGAGKDGVKYNVFSSGLHIPAEERDDIFKEEYRGKNSLNKPGSGHGLAFVRNAVEMHGGVVGYEPTKYGNNFYFILPI